MFQKAAIQNRKSRCGFAHRVHFPKTAADYRLAGAVRQAFDGLAILVILGGCAATPSQYLDETKLVDVTGAYQLADREVFEIIDLSELLRRYAPQCPSADPTITKNGTKDGAIATTKEQRRRLDDALEYFNRNIQCADKQSRKTSRNALQERLLAASAQRCNAYKGNLQRTFSRTNFGLGVLSTVAGTAGALVNSAAAASSWSAVSAISSGSRAEFNQDFMSNLAAYVIVDGIDKRRRIIYEQIQSRGQAKSYEAYPVEAAIKDALYYHGQCTVIAGFQEASDSIKTPDDLGVNAAIKAMAKIRAAHLMVHDDMQSPDAVLATSKKIIGDSQSTSGTELNNPPIAGTSLKGEDETDVAMDDFAAQIRHVESTNVLLRGALSDLADEAKKSDVLKDRLKELGLDTPPKPSTNIDEPLRTQCIAKLAHYLGDTSAAIVQAGLETTASKREEKLADAEMYRAQENLILAQAKLLAQDYQSKATIRIDKWKALFEKAKNATDTKDATKAFAQELNSLPVLDEARVKVLTGLCAPPSAN
jgi:hypothetical protein